MNHRSWVLLLLLGIALPAAGQIQDEAPTPVNEDDATLPETSLGNVVQTARSHYDSGVRLMKQSRKLAARVEGIEVGAKREKLEKNVLALREGAIDEFKEAIGYYPKLLAAYAGLGDALNEAGRPDQALSVHARALAIDSADDENFRGWAQALLALNLLGDATQAYSSLAEERPEQAAELMSQMKRWLAEKRADPGDLAPADVDRLADWIAQRENDAG